MSRDTQQFVCTILFGFGLYAAVSTFSVHASAEKDLNPTINQPSIEILALSRGRGVPETTFKALQEIIAVTNSARECGSVVSVKQETIGLEGETRLCIIFRDKQSLADIGNQIRKLATNIDLLQVNDHLCSGN